MSIKNAKEALDKVIRKSRVHLYKPIQIAEILCQSRGKGNLNIKDSKVIEIRASVGEMKFL